MPNRKTYSWKTVELNEIRIHKSTPNLVIMILCSKLKKNIIMGSYRLHLAKQIDVTYTFSVCDICTINKIHTVLTFEFHCFKITRFILFYLKCMSLNEKNNTFLKILIEIMKMYVGMESCQ